MPECQTNSYCQSSLLKASHSSENSLIWHCISPFLYKIQQCCNIKIAFILKIKLQLWNMTCYCTVHGPSMEAPSNKLQVVMHHMWWSSPKSNSKIQHQKQSFLGKIYSIMAWNWHEWVPMSVLSTVEVFSSTILHIFTCPQKQYEGVHFQFIQRALHTASVDSIFYAK